MGFLDKVKNMFIEEVDDDEIKKEVIQVKIPNPKEEEEEKEVEHDYEPNPKYDVDYEKPTLEEVKKEESKKEEIEKEEEKPSLPKFFDDNDFVQEPNIKPAKVFDDEIRSYKQNTYGTKKETKKVFKPTPIISPVYGVLDKNYKKEEISSKKKTPSTIYSQFDKIDVDDIRRKAYGTLEEELESNLSRDAIVFNDDIDVDMSQDKEISDYEEQSLDIFKELDKKDALDDLLNSYEVENEEHEVKNTEDLVEEELNRDYLDALNDEEEDNLIEEELSRDYDELADLEEKTEEEKEEEKTEEKEEENDLFDLIDSMYSKEEEE